MVFDSTARRLPTWRKAAAMLLACTVLCPATHGLAQSPAPQRAAQNGGNALVSADPFLGQNDLSVTDPATTPLRTAAPSDAQTGATTDTITTGSTPARPNPGEAIPEPGDEAVEPVDTRENTFETTVDGGENLFIDDGTAPGIRIGTLTLRPSISQTLNHESKSFPNTSTRRNYMTTGIRGTLTSDWARHALTVTGEGAYQRNLGGSSEGEQPSVNLAADLRLDLSDGTQANLTAGYAFSREDTNDPNAITNATVQGGEHIFSAGASIERNLGILKALAALDLSRTVYTDAKGANGQSISLADRDRYGANLRGRLGYELSPALVPFLEVTAGLSNYDQTRDNTGYARSSQSYGAKLGTQINLGEKWRGELSAGYLRREYDDSRLAAIDALTVDGNVIWSPLRGTEVNFGLRTTIEDFAGGPRGGWVSRQFTTGLTQQLRSNLVGRLTAGLERRSYLTSSLRDETEYALGAGLTWNVNRYLDFTTDIAYETTPVTDNSQWRIGAGLVLKR
ncbi:outer membrane beta-barrel protein [Agrobacterium larrymoorei]|uniref:outer membrane beta-barrel protein n=1 Tax=Agrobacterium larrymoorei TaxID=160699 RepID=UPI001572FA6B|nr:outer membrane beta-barrel protein [Agrobacterium larrymoorei]NTJ44015.1 outer membrane beta-barrel protein [Agrobacterium larrymoorei]